MVSFLRAKFTNFDASYAARGGGSGTCLFEVSDYGGSNRNFQKKIKETNALSCLSTLKL